MDNRLFFPATNRNRLPIGKILQKIIPNKGTVLEIASGSGEHGVYFQRLLPQITWQCSEKDSSCKRSINSWIKHENLHQIMPEAIDLDVEQNPWVLSKEKHADICSIVCINLIHISNWNCTLSLFKNSASILRKDSPLIIYGPFKRNGYHTSNSNMLFDKSLKDRNKSWGIRDIEDINEIARINSFYESISYKMPANNLSNIFIKK